MIWSRNKVNRRRRSAVSQTDVCHHILRFGLIMLVGCDGVIGSDRRLDKCGVCGGTDSTCHVISGIFTRTRLPTGYNRVTSVPRGACNINVTELIVSPNHLAIRLTNGPYIINGDYDSLGVSGDYTAVGTVFSYRRPAAVDDPLGLETPLVETIVAPGPINASIDIMVVQAQENRGIMYTYTIPASSRQHHVRHNHGSKKQRQRPATAGEGQGTSRTATAESRQLQDKPSGQNTSVASSSSRDRIQPDQEQQQQLSERVYRDYQELAHRQIDRHPRRPLVVPAAFPPPMPVAPSAEQNGYDLLQSDDTGVGRTSDADDGDDEPAVRSPAAAAVASPRPHPRAVTAAPRPQPGINYGLSLPRYVPGQVVSGGGGMPPGQQLQPALYQSQAAWPYAGQQVIPPVAVSQYQMPQYPVNAYQQHQSRPYVVPAPQQPYYLSPGHSALHDRQLQQQQPYDFYRGRHLPPAAAGALNDQSASVLLARSQAGGTEDLAGAEYAWKIAGFSECSETCGGGFQETQVVCMKVTGTQVLVTDDNCDPDVRPTSRIVTCNNTPCPAAWDATEWTECSTSCDRGQQTRTVECKQRISAVLSVSVTANRCIREPRPQTVRTCNEDKPCVRWKIGEWSQCSTECGRGQRTREVICVNTEDKQIAENKCSGAKPRMTEFCDMGSCARTWFYTTWSEECSTECGEGVHIRQVHCSAEPQRCNEINRPKSEKSCKNEIPCGGHWFTGPWSQCTVTCGDGILKRDVVCMKKLGTMLVVVGEENCLPEDKPDTEEQCEKDPCEPRWYMTDWSECSRSCDTGLQNREVKCLDVDQQQSESCDPDLRPEVRQTCNVHACPSSSQSSGQHGHSRANAAGTCKDKFKNCRVVVQARLCRYSYYKDVCCFSCISHGYGDSGDA